MVKSPAEEVVVDPAKSAREAGLRYVSDAKPGITRQKQGDGFVYLLAGKRVEDEEDLARIKRLAIPPVWTGVWICPKANGHLQATGRDARGRKQYRYHAHWREVRDGSKYEKMIAFGKALPGIRARVEEDLARPGLPKEKVLAAVVRLLETTLIRVGNAEYARTNKSYGLTTMRNRHVDVSGSAMKFHFRGKSGKTHEISLRDKRLAKIVSHCQQLEGQELFGYLDEEGNAVDITSGDVNRYLQEIAGEEFTAKDFRTWAGTKLAAIALQEFEAFHTGQEARGNVTRAIEAVAKMLGNTPAICRKCYVHPAVLDSYLDGTLAETLKQRAGQKLAESLHELNPEEAAVMVLLHERLKEKAG